MNFDQNLVRYNHNQESTKNTLVLLLNEYDILKSSNEFMLKVHKIISNLKTYSILFRL